MFRLREKAHGEIFFLATMQLTKVALQLLNYSVFDTYLQVISSYRIWRLLAPSHLHMDKFDLALVFYHARHLTVQNITSLLSFSNLSLKPLYPQIHDFIYIYI